MCWTDLKNNYVGQNLCEFCNLCAILPQLGKCIKFIVFRGRGVDYFA